MQISIELTREDYLEYNRFSFFESESGKKRLKKTRRMIVLLFLAVWMLLFSSNDFSLDALWIGGIVCLAAMTVFQLILKRYLFFAIRKQVERMEKRGKPGYSPSSVMEFSEEGFTEITEQMRLEQKYSAVEKVCLVEKKAIYLFVNEQMGFILPVRCFTSREQWEEFWQLLHRHCPVEERY